MTLLMPLIAMKTSLPAEDDQERTGGRNPPKGTKRNTFSRGIAANLPRKNTPQQKKIQTVLSIGARLPVILSGGLPASIEEWRLWSGRN